MEELVVTEDPITGTWTFSLKGQEVEVQPKHGLVKINGRLHQIEAVQGLPSVQDLAGAPLNAITRLLTLQAATADFPGAPVTPPPQVPTERQEEPTPMPTPEPTRKPPPRRPPRTRPPARPKPPQPAETRGGAFDTRAAAKFLSLSPKTLETLRTRGGGPTFSKLGRRVVYRREDLDSWLKNRRRASTSDLGR